LKDPGVVEQLIEWNADVYIIAAFGQIFRKNILDIPKFGLINVHASLLPRWRGAAPIQAAILAGDEQTGVSIMKIDAGIDTGDVFAKQPVRIDPQETSVELSQRLAQIGSELLIKTLPDYLAGRNLGIPQNEEFATYAGMIKKEDAVLNIEESSEILCRKVRAYQPWPIAKLEVDGVRLLIHKAHYLLDIHKKVGTKFIYQNYPAMATGDGLLILDQVQLPGKRVVDGRSFLQGNRNWGVTFSTG
jgi:methionyl-tRNA formyltransferase